MSGELDGVIDRLERAERDATDLLDRYTDLFQIAEACGQELGRYSPREDHAAGGIETELSGGAEAAARGVCYVAGAEG